MIACGYINLLNNNNKQKHSAIITWKVISVFLQYIIMKKQKNLNYLIIFNKKRAKIFSFYYQINLL